MKKITFKVSSQKEGSVISLIKEINKISCRIYINLENGYVTVENVSDTMIDTVIELLDNYYTVLGVDIDNTFEETPEVQVAPVVAESSADAVEETAKVEFENKYLENIINTFLKTAYWALYNKNATTKGIGESIITCTTEISMRYSSNPIIEFCVGDIVDVNYGSHLPGEIMGGHVHAIVCNVLNEDMAYIVPITKVRKAISSLSYLFINSPQDAIYNNQYYKGGIVLLDKGKYVRVERFNSLIGKTKPEFFKKLLHQLATTFDFTNNLTEATQSNIVVPSTTLITNSKAVKLGVEETSLLEVIGFAFDKLDTLKTAEEQVESFLTDIGMTTTEKMVTQSFIIACDVKKINYENILLELHNQFPELKEEAIKNILKRSFKDWLKNYPTLVEKCPKLSFISILRMFAKKFV